MPAFQPVQTGSWPGGRFLLPPVQPPPIMPFQLSRSLLHDPAANSSLHPLLGDGLPGDPSAPNGGTSGATSGPASSAANGLGSMASADTNGQPSSFEGALGLMGSITGTAFGVPGVGTALGALGGVADFSNAVEANSAKGFSNAVVGPTDYGMAALHGALPNAVNNAFGFSSPQSLANAAMGNFGDGPFGPTGISGDLAAEMDAANQSGVGPDADATNDAQQGQAFTSALGALSMGIPSVNSRGTVGITPGMEPGSVNNSALSTAISNPGSGIDLGSIANTGYNNSLGFSPGFSASLGDAISNPGTPGGLAGVTGGPSGPSSAAPDTGTANAFSGFSSSGLGSTGETGTGADGGSDSGGGSSVICTELHRRGVLSDEIFAADLQAGREQPREVIAGYHLWAKPVVQLMKRSPLAYMAARYIGSAWANEMAFRRGVKEAKTTRLGRFIVKYGPPVCGLIDLLRRKFHHARIGRLENQRGRGFGDHPVVGDLVDAGHLRLVGRHELKADGVPGLGVDASAVGRGVRVVGAACQAVLIHPIQHALRNWLGYGRDRDKEQGGKEPRVNNSSRRFAEGS